MEEAKGTRRHYYITLLKDKVQEDNMEGRQTKVEAEGRSRWANCSLRQWRKNIQRGKKKKRTSENCQTSTMSDFKYMS